MKLIADSKLLRKKNTDTVTSHFIILKEYLENLPGRKLDANGELYKPLGANNDVQSIAKDS
jgi:hypothetical protein